MKSGPIAALVAISLAGCVIDIDYSGSSFRCADGVCPDGFTCVAAQCVPDDGVVDAGLDTPDAAPLVDPALIGNVLYFPFEGDYAPSPVTFDRGPNHIPAEDNGPVALVAGKYGNARSFDDEDADGLAQSSFLLVPDSPRLFSGNTITIEAWIQPDEAQNQAIYSDFDSGDAPEAEYSLELTSAGDLTFISNSSCDVGNESVSTTGQNIPLNVYTYVALTWDGSEVVFYIDGTAVETQPFAHTPCEFPGTRNPRIGRRDGGGSNFSGEIDEVKVSSYAKTADQIVASMNFDPTATYPLCGDLFVEGSEQCEGQLECCDLATCSLEPDDSGCSNGGTCQSGVCVVSEPRVTSGLLALYEFDEGTGTTVGDSVDPALDLTIADPLNVTWGTGTLTVNTATIVASAAPAAKISDACKATNELTVEAWVSPATDTQSGPARIVTVSLDSSDRNFTLGQVRDLFVTRVRAQGDGNGSPEVVSAPGAVDTANLVHVVSTRRSNGERRMYVNGRLVGFDFYDGDFSGWDSTWLLGLANEFIDNRRWLGTLGLVAVYDRALSDAEVMQNFSAGP